MGQEEVRTGYQTWAGGERGNRTDTERILGQNTSEGAARWGLGHKEYLEGVKTYLQEEGIALPRRYAELGVGPDAVLVANTLNVFGDSLEDGGLAVFEIDPERLAGAERTLKEQFADRPTLLNKLRFVAGDAGETLPGEGKFDIIHAQLLFQHLLPQERKNILQASAQQLSENGLLLVSDLAFDDWTARSTSRRLSPRRLRTTRVAERTRQTINMLRQTGYKVLGKNDFDDEAAIERMITDETVSENENPMLEIIPGLRRQWRVANMQPGDDEVELMAQIVHRLTGGDITLEVRAEEYVEDIRRGEQGVSFDYPTMVRTAARRIRSSA